MRRKHPKEKIRKTKNHLKNKRKRRNYLKIKNKRTLRDLRSKGMIRNLLSK